MFFPIVPAMLLIFALAYYLWIRPTCCPVAEHRAASKYKMKGKSINPTQFKCILWPINLYLDSKTNFCSVMTEMGVNDQVDILMRADTKVYCSTQLLQY